ncbi:hypothetical protein [Marinirhabdus gelatinilytica]|uniref:Tetratricopeptide repeat protein n=1 Tax=Marinirhabdus gelatinilytica TaxID=1703343 RepID=A0A370QKC7_9FLAO|nr:hypothetical protein [Marinirhabdus gelatinilytica]RDK88817.1 hypothetical protein C8D94_101694 [Marinirhabdus gelatinilytica]
MKEQRPKLLALTILLVCSIAGFSQQKINVNKDIDVVKVYEQTVKDGYPTLEIYQKLATAHYFRSNYEDAKKWFEKWFEMELPKDPTAKYRYRQTLKALKVSAKNNKYLAVIDHGSS